MARKSLKDELSVLRRFEQLSPVVFSYVKRSLASKNKEDRLWAMEWLKPGFAKLLPTKIAGDKEDRTPIPIIAIQNALLLNNDDGENKETIQKN
jgi:negative regulator of sigma E activity